MCGQVVGMQGTVRFGAGARSPFPGATLSRRAVMAISAPLPEQRPRDRPYRVARRVHQLSLRGGAEDGQPAMRAQLRLPVQLPLHAGAEEVEFVQAARAR